jgi:Homeodomain-like domain
MPVTLICQYPPCSKSFVVSNYRKYTAFFCSVRCHHNARMESQRLNFWKKVSICIHGQDCIFCCWPWNGMLVNTYGETWIDGKKIGAHRCAWEMWNKRSIPTGLHAAHYCHFRPCCNAAHIHPATPQENSDDSVRDKRRPFGESHGNSKLTEPMVFEAFRLKEAGWSYKQIARHYEVSRSTIYAAIKGQNWKYIKL